MEVKEGSVEGNNKKVPTVLKNASEESSLQDTVSWIKSHKSEIQKRWLETGALLFRGFPLSTPQDFLEFINAFEWEFSTYLGAAGPRNHILGPIHTSTETPPNVKIQLHHEMAYSQLAPSALFFFCEIPPAAGGETPILASYTLYERLKAANPNFIDLLTTKKVKYASVVLSKEKCDGRYQRSWQEIYQTDSQEEAAKKAQAIGPKEKIEFLPDGSMHVITAPMEAIRFDERTQRHVFYNSVVLLHPATHGIADARKNMWGPTYGDSSQIASEDVLGALKIMNEEKVEFQWQKGDVLLVDNTLVLHARNSFTPPRRILTAMLK
eukprot:Phypoly_transcript_11612.p1 GENE.Phypoly_transcript_11612~~Phypoly_transcript_11612.p1  ORF type:complete len:323 (+),score=55.22 Phypoly_transcript_11612:144-1112(+)